MLRHPIITLVRHILGFSTTACHCCLTHTLTLHKICRWLFFYFRGIMVLSPNDVIFLIIVNATLADANTMLFYIPRKF